MHFDNVGCLPDFVLHHRAFFIYDRIIDFVIHMIFLLFLW